MNAPAQVKVGNGCVHYNTSRTFGPAGLCCALCCFPCGMLCCLAWSDKKCNNCQQKLDPFTFQF